MSGPVNVYLLTRTKDDTRLTQVYDSWHSAVCDAERIGGDWDTSYADGTWVTQQDVGLRPCVWVSSSTDGETTWTISVKRVLS
jgi:hypothetical protein